MSSGGFQESSYFEHYVNWLRHFQFLLELQGINKIMVELPDSSYF